MWGEELSQCLPPPPNPCLRLVESALPTGCLPGPETGCCHITSLDPCRLMVTLRLAGEDTDEFTL